MPEIQDTSKYQKAAENLETERLTRRNTEGSSMKRCVVM